MDTINSMDELPIIEGDINLRYVLQQYFPYEIAKELIISAKEIGIKVVQTQAEREPTLPANITSIFFPKYAVKPNEDNTFTLVVITDIDEETDIYTEMHVSRIPAKEIVDQPLPPQGN